MLSHDGGASDVTVAIVVVLVVAMQVDGCASAVSNSHSEWAETLVKMEAIVLAPQPRFKENKPTTVLS